ncbi:MAG: MMPL family transporter, partial [Eubacteriales bacterium]|nr:MMPL family transporter [Eubacteriales bacterium]
MERFFGGVIRNRKRILLGFIIVCVICFFCRPLISVNYDMNAYLPEDVASSVALDVMEEEFDSGIPNVRVMIRDVTIPEALRYKEKLSQIDGVTDVTWLDDAVDVMVPLETMDADTLDIYYVDETALYSVTLEEEQIISAVADIRELIGEDNAMTGSAVSTAVATDSTVSEIKKIAIFAILLLLFILVLTMTSWLEPVVVLTGLGVAVLINAGSNLIFGEISFVTNAAGNILQLAVSLDYSVFLIHRFEECRLEEKNPKIAMRKALLKSVSSILSSGLTTVIGFLALAFMRFRIGPDLGFALAKGIAISLIVVFGFMPGLILMTYPY